MRAARDSASAAARTGATTILLERFGYLGGCTTAPYNTSIGHFADSDGNRIIGGLGWEFLRRMEKDGECRLSRNGHNQLWPVWTRKVALDMTGEAGVELWLHTWVSGVVANDGQIEGLVVVTKRGPGVVRVRSVVDASGDADIAAFAKAPFEMTPLEELQQVSCDYIACGVDADAVARWARDNPDRVTRVVGLNNRAEGGRESMLTFVVPSDTTDFHSRVQNHVGVMPTVKLCIHRDAVRIQGNVEIDPLDPRALTHAEVAGLRGALEHLAYLRETIPGFENAFAVAQSHLGVRETRRIVGDYLLTSPRLGIEHTRRVLDGEVPGTAG